MDERSLRLRNVGLQSKYKEYKAKISDFLEREPIKKKEMKIQDFNSDIEIPDIDIAFGAIHDDDSIIIANWVFNLKVKEREPVLDFLVAKECFRLFLEFDIKSDNNYYDFSEIFLNVITLQWLVMEDKIAGLSDAKKMDIFKRCGFKDRDYYSLKDFTSTIFFTYRYETNPLLIFKQYEFLLKEAINKDIANEDIFKRMKEWFDRQFELEEVALPIFITERHFNVINELIEIGSKASAKMIGSKLDLSYNVINIDFKRLYDKYLVYWAQNFFLPKLGLYPYYFRITLPDESQFETLLKILILYKDNMDYLLTGKSDEGFIVTSNINCSHFVHQELNFQLEKLLKKKTIKNYFFSMQRRKRITASFSIDEKLEYDQGTYNNLLNNPSKYNYKKVVLLDELYDTSYVKKRKSTIDENVLLYLSILKGRHLGKAHYLFNPVELILKLCEINNVNTQDNTAFMYFINQLDMRCRRLKLLNYYLNVNAQQIAKAFYLELIVNPNDKVSKEIIHKLEIFANISILEFIDRTLIIFPSNNNDRLLHDSLLSMLDNLELNYKMYSLTPDLTSIQREIRYNNIVKIDTSSE
ncbi:MAG: hypothetical protein FK733_15650 [Asgard group archaeon]|nr:hypothetical protein [Asgard group archaeon]